MRQAVIFDMDGVVSDTQKFHAEAERLILQNYGIVMNPEDITKRFAGVSDDVMFEEIFEQYGVKVNSVGAIVSAKWNLMGDIAKDSIKPIPYAPELIHNLRENGLLLAIASASTEKFIQEVLSELALTACFDAIVSSQEVTNGKPAPDIFLLAAKRLHVKPKHCVVIEDGRSGMIGAAKAGMKCIGLINDQHADYPADKLISSLVDIRAQDIYDLLATPARG